MRGTARSGGAVLRPGWRRSRLQAFRPAPLRCAAVPGRSRPSPSDDVRNSKEPRGAFPCQCRPTCVKGNGLWMISDSKTPAPPSFAAWIAVPSCLPRPNAGASWTSSCVSTSTARPLRAWRLETRPRASPAPMAAADVSSVRRGGYARTGQSSDTSPTGAGPFDPAAPTYRHASLAPSTKSGASGRSVRLGALRR